MIKLKKNKSGNSRKNKNIVNKNFIKLIFILAIIIVGIICILNKKQVKEADAEPLEETVQEEVKVVKENTKNSIILNLDILKNGETEKTQIKEVSYIPIYMYKAGSGINKYSVLDIEKSIIDYEDGANTSIGSTTYNTLKNELKKIRNTLGENIIF